MRQQLTLRFFAISLSFASVSWAGPRAPVSMSQGTAQAPRAGKTIVYANHEYGFKFYLPESWRGFTVDEKEWEGDIDSSRKTERGPLLLIRHPLDREDNPRQDTPIMVLTHCQWRGLDDNSLLVSAAPYPPEEIARNRQFVFAIPPRFT
jgi:hypothetical protein